MLGICRIGNFGPSAVSLIVSLFVGELGREWIDLCYR